MEQRLEWWYLFNRLLVHIKLNVSSMKFYKSFFFKKNIICVGSFSTLPQPGIILEQNPSWGMAQIRLSRGHLYGSLSWWIILAEGHSSLWVVPFLRQAILDCVRKLGEHKPASLLAGGSIHRGSWQNSLVGSEFLSQRQCCVEQQAVLPSGFFCDFSPRCPSMMDSDLKFKPKKSFLP